MYSRFRCHLGMYHMLAEEYNYPYYVSNYIWDTLFKV